MGIYYVSSTTKESETKLRLVSSNYRLDRSDRKSHSNGVSVGGTQPGVSRPRLSQTRIHFFRDSSQNWRSSLDQNDRDRLCESRVC
ncbi:unnamed protein product [Camellia sinensis]